MPHYAILGSTGQLGREFASRLPADETAALTRDAADLAIPGQVAKLIHTLAPRIVINCAAYNLVDRAEDEPSLAFAANALGVRELARACQEIGAALVHFSTDYVFGMDQSRREPYCENDAPGPLGAYGLSKLTGEYFVRAEVPSHYVIRTCGLYGTGSAAGKGGNFVQTMLKLARAGKPIRVVNDQVLTPTSAADVAAATLQLLKQNSPGLYHLTNAGECSWFDFAAAIFRLSGVAADLRPTTTLEYGSKARRPAYSVLTTQFEETPRLRPWEEGLAEYLNVGEPSKQTSGQEA